MNQTIRQNQAVLACMRLRAKGLNESARKSAGLPPACRFKVMPTGGNKFEVVDAKSGQRRGERVGHGPACSLAAELETKVARAESAGRGARRLGRAMLGWVVGISVCATAFALYGS